MEQPKLLNFLGEYGLDKYVWMTRIQGGALEYKVELRTEDGQTYAMGDPKDNEHDAEQDAMAKARAIGKPKKITDILADAKVVANENAELKAKIAALEKNVKK
jgi:polyhydroxyalkanoate synthesis regulator phasin